jgi:hypothetical protein
LFGISQTKLSAGRLGRELSRAAERSCNKEEIMKSLRLLLSIVMLTVCAVAHAQSSGKPVAISDAQKAFDLMKTLAGNWQGPATTDNPAWSTDKPISLSMRVASHGNALVHELNTGTPEITVFYVESDRLSLIHYCDFGNRPHMVARPSSDGKTVEFDLVDFSGSDKIGHVSHGVFTIIDASHHSEDWTFMPAGDKPVHAHVDFKRVP